MGTRADFYVGVGQEAEWLGSIAYDGYVWSESRTNPLRKAKTEKTFRKVVARILADRGDATLPSMGWPWPWEDSRTTDYAYYFLNGKVRWAKRNDWPSMKDKQKITFGNRSGLMIFGIPNK